MQLTIFTPLSQSIVDRIEATDVNSLTPLQALNLLEELQQQKLKEKGMTGRFARERRREVLLVVGLGGTELTGDGTCVAQAGAARRGSFSSGATLPTRSQTRALLEGSDGTVRAHSLSLRGRGRRDGGQAARCAGAHALGAGRGAGGRVRHEDAA